MVKNNQNNVYIYFCFGPIFFCARTNLSPVPWMGKELFPRDCSHRNENDQPNPPTAEVNVCKYTPYSPTLLHGKWLNSVRDLPHFLLWHMQFTLNTLNRKHTEVNKYELSPNYMGHRWSN
jgi:hypothetical protein